MKSMTFALAIIAFSAQAGQADELIRLEVSNAEIAADPTKPGSFVLNIRLDARSAEAFATWTGRHLGERVNFLVDDSVLAQPKVVAPIERYLQLAGASRNLAAMKDIAQRLKDGRSTLSVQAP